MFATIDRSCKRKKQKKKKKRKEEKEKVASMIYRRSVCLNFISPETIGNDSLRHRSVYPIRNERAVGLIPLSFPFPPPFPFLPDDRWNCNENFTRCEFPVPKLARIRVGGLTRQSEHCSQTETSRISLIRVSSVAAYRLSDAIVFHARIEGEEGVY